ncbi:MAG: DUF5657 family protein [Patescibacteria group bacterium]|nr:DUF5657 family protein [Patescibacteria group bacterium]
MIEEVIPLQFNLVTLVEYILGVLVLFYVVFSLLAVRQIHLLVMNIKTSVSGWVYAVGFINFIFAFLAFAATIALIF